MNFYLSVCDGDECLVFAMADEKPVEIPHPLEEIRALQSILQAFALSASSSLSCTMTCDPAANRIVVLFGSGITSSELSHPVPAGSKAYTEAMESMTAFAISSTCRNMAWTW